MAESFRFRNDSAISSMPTLCTYERQGKLRDLANVTIHIEPGAAHLLKTRQLMHATLHPLLRRNTRHRTVIRNELHRTGYIKRATRSTQNIQTIPADIIHHLHGSRASTRMPARQQLRRIAGRKLGKTRAHQLLRRGSSQRAGGGKLTQEPAAAGAVHLAAQAGAAVIVVKFNLVQFSHATSIEKALRRETPAPPGIQILQQNGRSCFQSLSLSEPTRHASAATLIQQLREPGCQPPKAYPRMRRGT